LGPVRDRLTMDDVDELETRARTPDGHRAAAAQLAAWAEETHPEDDGEVTPALLLVKAGEQLGFAGDHEAAVIQFRRAVTAAGDVPPDVRCYLHHGLLQVGDVEGARRIADDVRRSKPVDPNVYEMIAEDHELAGDLPQANRWLTLGLQRQLAQAEDGDVPDDASLLLVARRRVRRALGFPPDEFDALLPALPE
jgi:predicted Zn-dependent protease